MGEKLMINIIFKYYLSLGWTGVACDIPDCPEGCKGNGFCNGTGRAVPECECLEVDIKWYKNDNSKYILGQF